MSEARRLGALVLALACAACGFQLQGSSSWPADWRAFELDYPGRDAEVRQLALITDEALRRRAVNSGAGGFKLRLQDVHDRKLIAAIGADGKAVEFELQRSLSFRVSAAGQRSSQLQVSAGRRYSFDPAILLAKEAEEERLQAELSREVVELMLLRVEAQLRAWQLESGQLDQDL